MSHRDMCGRFRGYLKGFINIFQTFFKHFLDNIFTVKTPPSKKVGNGFRTFQPVTNKSVTNKFWRLILTVSSWHSRHFVDRFVAVFVVEFVDINISRTFLQYFIDSEKHCGNIGRAWHMLCRPCLYVTYSSCFGCECVCLLLSLVPFVDSS